MYNEELDIRIEKSNRASMDIALEKWNATAKPLHSLGKLEKLIVKLAGIYGDDDFTVDKKCVIVVCADNGVVEEGVSQADSSVTSAVALDMCKGTSNINIMAKAAGADTIVVDMGMRNELNDERILNRRISPGTNNITKGPAMTREQAVMAVKTGCELVRMAKGKGYKLVVTGEMGIGNTTSSSALAAAMLNKKPQEVTGRGAGLSSEGLNRKIAAIEKALSVNAISKDDDPIAIMAKVGGYDIAAMAGMFLGGGIYHIPIVIDGFISAIAALLAYRIDEDVIDYMVESHISKEPAGIEVINELKLDPIIHGDMCLGEGTGGVCLLPLIDIALREYKEAHKFTDANIEQYKEYK